MSTDATTSADATTHLPDDPAVLQRMIRELLETLRGTRRENEQLQHRLDQLLRRLYGPRAERFDPNQPLLFAELPPPPPPAETPPAPAAEPKKAKPHGRRQLPTDLRRVQRVYELTEAERCCPTCHQVRTEIGADKSEQLDYQPASVFVVEHVRKKYACTHCQEHVTIAAKPAQPIDKGLPGPGLLAHVIVNKYGDHLPLYRQEHILARLGVELQRSTLCGWMAAGAQLLRPLADLMKQEVLRSQVIWTDDTPVPVLDEKRDTTRQGRLWTYIGDRDHPFTVFDYTPDHSRAGPSLFLAGFRGYLQADAFAGYDAIYTGSAGDIIEIACWAHTRRKFYEARTTDPTRGHEALARIRQLYDVEDQVKNLSDEERAAYRQQQALPLLNAFREWLDREAVAALPKSPMGQAIRYALSNWDALIRYPQAGFLSIDNNVSERTLRAIGIGRKNWMFVGSDNGGMTAAILFGMIATCKRHGIDPFFYLRDVFTRIGDHPPERLAELLPHRWAAARRTEAEVAPPNTS
jgi:transposase